MPIASPLALFIYNRTEHLPAVIEAICAAAPPCVFIFADGPGAKDGDAGRCEQARALVRAAPWPCPVRFDFASFNRGCTASLVAGIDAVFAQAPAAIFLEDDAVPAAPFFAYCDALLAAYRDTPEVMMISGVNALGAWPGGVHGHFFSTLGNAQAWASWRRAWAAFAGAAFAWGDAGVQERVRRLLADDQQSAARDRVYRHLADPVHGSWDYQWALARQMHGGLTAVPAVNLVRHAGRGSTATRVRRAGILDPLSATHEALPAIAARMVIEPDRAYDRFVFEATHDCLSGASARELARRLARRGRLLQALALLRHHDPDRWRSIAAEIGLYPGA